MSLGDGTTSEGEFWESLNTACTRRLPVVYLVEDNGWAISVPVEVADARRQHRQTAPVVPDLLIVTATAPTSPTATGPCARPSRTRAPGAARRSCTPASIRPYSHSLSDDERLYKTPEEREAEARRDPVKKMARLAA